MSDQHSIARKMTRCRTRVCKRTLELSTVRTHTPKRKQGSKGKPLFSFSFFAPVRVIFNETGLNALTKKNAP